MELLRHIILLAMVLLLGACSGRSSNAFRDQNMDFGVIQNVAVMPMANHTREQSAGDRVRDVLFNKLLYTGGLYAVPLGEVKRGTMRAATADATAPSPEEVVKLAGILKVDAIITGAVKEYGEVRSGNAVANVISVSVQMLETQTGRIIWSASSTKGGVGFSDRLLGGGGDPMNVITEKAIDEILDKLFI
ncbi:MAG: penicillin-binding protein activator LpoB [Nitrospirota bacterium]